MELCKLIENIKSIWEIFYTFTDKTEKRSE